MTHIAGLHVVTDAQLCPGRGHLWIAKAAVEAGAPVVQLRDKLLDDGPFYEVALAVRNITREAGALFVVNDRVDAALAVKADGVHVGRKDLPASVVRALVGTGMILGVSAASIQEALEAEKDGADYVGFGPIFATATKPDAGEAVGLDQLKLLKSAIGIPVIAIGGIGPANVESVADAGADGAAVVSAIVCADDMREAVKALTGLFAIGASRRR